MSTNQNRFIYFNKTSGKYRILITVKKGKVEYFGTYDTLESAVIARDKIAPNGVNPFAKGFARNTHSKTDEQIMQQAVERAEQFKKELGIL